LSEDYSYHFDYFVLLFLERQTFMITIFTGICFVVTMYIIRRVIRKHYEMQLIHIISLLFGFDDI